VNRYLVRTYQLPREQEEAVCAALWEQGTLGLETVESASGLRLLAYFEVPAPPLALPPAAARLIDERLVAEEDWLAAYRAQAQPREVGRRLLVDPREPGTQPPPIPAGRTLLRLPARTAFGTGSHASTRLVLIALEELPLAGRSVLDIGTGSGILAFAALRYGARRAVAFDLDLAAVLVARQNQQLNEVEGVCLFAGGLVSLAPAASFDVALVNVLPHRILDEAPAVVGRLRSGGTLVVSGLLGVDAGAVLALWEAAGVRRQRLLAEEEWAAAILVRP
jgi:ribosomal protein L11 methyltransferase